MIDAGELVDGRYRADGLLGSGGFADVYLATDLETDTVVALKILRTRDPLTRRRFAREGRVLAGLSSPHVTRLLGSGATADGTPYLVFELAGGDDLSTMLGQHKRLERSEAIEILRQLLHALSEAHAAGVLHRDIKPENVRVRYAGGAIEVKLLDFGIARVTDDGSPALTAAGELIGTPQYMSPEQLTQRPLGPASDIYSLGVLAFELLLGRDAMQGNRWSNQLERLQSGYLFPAEGLEGRPGLLAVFRRMTARDPAERFQSARAVLAALDALEQRPARQPRIGSAVRGKSERSRAHFVMGAVAALLAVSAIAFLARKDPAPTVVDTRRIPTRPEPAAQTAAQLLVVAEPSDAGFDRCASMRGGFTDMLGDRYPAYVPHNAPDEPMPLLMMLHGNGMSANLWLRTSPFVELAEEHGFMIVAPNDTLVQAWNKRNEQRRALRELHRTIVESFCVDEARSFLLGHEQSGGLTYHVACDAWPTAIAINAYSLSDPDFKCADAPAKPSLLILPLDFGWMPPDGGPNCKGTEKLSFDAQEEMWRKRNGCTDPARSERLPGAECHEWTCKTPFKSCRHPGGGDWAEALPGRLKDRCAAGAPEFARAEHIWRFFESTVADRAARR